MRPALMTLAAGVAFVLAPGLASADVSVALFLEINGTKIDGENPVTSLDRENSIQVLSISNAVTTPRDAASGQLTGARQHKPITFTKRIDKSTPLLYKALTQNEQITEAQFRFYRSAQGGGEELFYTIVLQNGYVSFVGDAGGKSDDVPTEMVSFVFQNITWTYEPTGTTHTDE